MTELLNIKGFTSPEILDCGNGLLKEAERKSELYLSFRQVSHLIDNQKNGFSFFFAGLTKKSLKKRIYFYNENIAINKRYQNRKRSSMHFTKRC